MNEKIILNLKFTDDTVILIKKLTKVLIELTIKNAKGKISINISTQKTKILIGSTNRMKINGKKGTGMNEFIIITILRSNWERI